MMVGGNSPVAHGVGCVDDQGYVPLYILILYGSYDVVTGPYFVIGSCSHQRLAVHEDLCSIILVCFSYHLTGNLKS